MSFLGRLFNRFRAGNANKTQTFHVRYQVMLHNKAPKANDIIVVAPMPIDRGGQEVLSNPQASPEPERVGRETRFGNDFVFWQMKLAPGEHRMTTVSFPVRIKPIRRAIKSLGLLSDYKRVDMSVYKGAHLQDEHPDIIQLAKQAAGETQDVATILMKLNELVLSRLEYGNPIKGLYSALDALCGVKVDCGGYDTLFVALCLSLGIPARVVAGFWAGHEKNTMHAWAEVFLPSGEWLPVDPSTEQLARAGRTRKIGGLGIAGSDRIIVSVGSDLDIEVGGKKLTIDILQHPFVVGSQGEGSVGVETLVHTVRV